MSRFELDNKVFQKEAHQAVFSGAIFLHSKVVPMTPRDWNRAPKPIDRKDGKKPVRNTGPFRPVSHNGHWYVGVSGNLRKSVLIEERGPMDFIVGVERGPTEEYGRAQEFGTFRMPARSFLRKALIENHKDILNTMQTVFYQLTTR